MLSVYFGRGFFGVRMFGRFYYGRAVAITPSGASQYFSRHYYGKHFGRYYFGVGKFTTTAPTVRVLDDPLFFGAGL